MSSPHRRFEMLYADHRLEVLAYCTRRMQAADAADACSETFLVAWRRIEDIPSPPGTLPYLYGIASRVVANQLRTLRRRSRLEERLQHLGVAPPPEPLAIVLQNSQDQKVVAALHRLKPRDREIVMLYTWESLPRDTIAQMMGMTRGAIDQRIHRSYQRLARTIDPAPETRRITSPPTAEKGGT
ncbi:MAG: RNA polymerase sigma factor [Actinomycetota bacterium]